VLKGEAFLKHYDTNKSVTLKKWLSLPPEEKREYNEELNFANLPGDIVADIFGEELKKGMPVYVFKGKGLKAFCVAGNYSKLTAGQQTQFEPSLTAYTGGGSKT
jgi:hypothetical protein